MLLCNKFRLKKVGNLTPSMLMIPLKRDYNTLTMQNYHHYYVIIIINFVCIMTTKKKKKKIARSVTSGQQVFIFYEFT